MSTNPLKIKDFLLLYFPLLVSFLSARAIGQTDLVMLGSLGDVFVAAHAISMKLMIVDTILAMSVGPVAAILVSQSSMEARFKAAKNVLSMIFYLSLILLAVGLVIYPFLTKVFINDANVGKVATTSIVAMTLTIPARLLFFVGSLIANIFGKGRSLVLQGIAAFGLNLALNYIFMFALNIGLAGCYIATFITSCIQAWLALKQIPEIGWRTLLVVPTADWCIKLFKLVTPELIRVSSGTLSAAILASMFATKASLGPLTAFGVASELQLLMSMPMVAMMRAISLEIAPNNFRYTLLDHYKRYVNFQIFVVGICLGISIFLWSYSGWLAVHVYGLSDESLSWFTAYCRTLALGLPFWALHYMLQGLLQGRQEYRTMAFADGFAQWVLMLAICGLGLINLNPKIVWSGLVVGALFPGYLSFAILFFKERYFRSRLITSQAA